MTERLFQETSTCQQVSHSTRHSYHEDEVEGEEKKFHTRIPTSLDHFDCLLLKSEITLL